ncbi:MAG: response regulator transcription factor [Clostridia bacterium]|nr:response regulator transcription factor [Clostridia bacterium]MBR6742724.1 response regulator transcription factor [Clostridia bacterium]
MPNTEQKRILVVEDDKNISMLLQFNITTEGYLCDVASDGDTGLSMALSGNYDLLLLDVMLPGRNGFEICTAVRKRSDVPIIMCTAREEEKDKILGLEIGADDYITKPFSTRELLSRIKANIRRSSGELTGSKQATEKITVRGLVIDQEKYLVEMDGAPVELSKLEYDLLLKLASTPGKPHSREELLEKVWGYNGFFGDIRTVDVTVSRLREKIEKDPAKPEYLLTKRGVGYYIS